MKCFQFWTIWWIKGYVGSNLLNFAEFCIWLETIESFGHFLPLLLFLYTFCIQGIICLGINPNQDYIISLPLTKLFPIIRHGLFLPLSWSQDHLRDTEQFVSVFFAVLTKQQKRVTVFTGETGRRRLRQLTQVVVVLLADSPTVLLSCSPTYFTTHSPKTSTITLIKFPNTELQVEPEDN